MYATIEALENGNRKTLCFYSKKDARDFKSFTNTYMDDSGAGNGYNAYWILFDSEIIQCDKIPDNTTTSLRPNLIDRMLEGILIARTTKIEPDVGVGVRIAKKEGTITFSIDELPFRKTPTKDDMFRLIKSQANEDEIRVREGRVLEDLGDTLKVYSYSDEMHNGKPIEGAEIIEVRTASVMKINDWLQEGNQSCEVKA